MTQGETRLRDPRQFNRTIETRNHESAEPREGARAIQLNSDNGKQRKGKWDVTNHKVKPLVINRNKVGEE